MMDWIITIVWYVVFVPILASIAVAAGMSILIVLGMWAWLSHEGTTND